MVIGTDSKQKYDLFVPAEAMALIIRAFGESRRAAVQGMSLKQLARETRRALHALTTAPARSQGFAVGDIVRWPTKSTKDGV